VRHVQLRMSRSSDAITLGKLRWVARESRGTRAVLRDEIRVLHRLAQQGRTGIQARAGKAAQMGGRCQSASLES